MHNKILLLTTIYPSPDIIQSNSTNVVHYFAKEWLKMGYDVRVVFNYPIYLRIFHLIAWCIKNILASKFNTSVTVTYTKEDKKFELDGVNVYRIPLYKPFPHGKVSDKMLDEQVSKIHLYLERENFIPDVIVAHNFYPHVPMVNALHDKYYKEAKTAIVIHKQRMVMLDYINNCHEQIRKIDLWGYRSVPLKHEFESATGKHDNYFMCYSGIPETFLKESITRDYKNPMYKFVYVGSFIRRKHTDKIIDALYQLGKPFYLDLVGDGANKKLLKDKVKKYQIDSAVKFHGFLPREEVPLIIKEAECFIMISEEETFGLVYLEAMSMGCLTIASKNEGMDGIIIDGFNGFLCKAGDTDDLIKTINIINSLSREEKNEISNHARDTALKLTDKSVAKYYAECLFK